MIRVNQFDFYQLGYTFHSLSVLENNPTREKAYLPLLEAEFWLKRLISGSLIELTFCRPQLQELQSAINEILQSFRDEKTRKFKDSINWKEQLSSWTISSLKKGIEKLEHNLAAEFLETLIYYVPRRGIYDTAKLAGSADSQLPPQLHKNINEKALQDYKDAGRCLAFDLPTAVGFHVMRSVEGVLIDYHALFTHERKPDRTMGELLVELDNFPKDKTQRPDEKTLRTIRDIKNYDRNPLMHPRETLDSTMAMGIFNLATAAIIAMTSEIETHLNIEKLSQLNLEPPVF